MIGPWVIFIVSILIPLFYIFSFDVQPWTDRVVGGGYISLFLLPWVGFISLILKNRKNFQKFLILIFLFFCGHIFANHSMSSFIGQQISMNPFAAVYLAVWISGLEVIPLLFLCYVMFKPFDQLSCDSVTICRNLRYSPLIVVTYAIMYGILVGLSVEKYYQSSYFVFLTSFIGCYALLVAVFSIFLLRLPNHIIENIILEERFKYIPKIDFYFILFLLFFIIASALSELGRGLWFFWGCNTFVIVLALIGQWKFIRLIFLQKHKENVLLISASCSFPNVTSRRFLIWNVGIYLTLVLLVILIFG